MEAFEGWLAGAQAHRRAYSRPLVTLSYAQSLDGSLALPGGHPTCISGPESQRMTHRLRALHQAILVGIGTVLADDPLLTVRLVEGEHPQPIVLDSRLRTPRQARVLSVHPKPAWIVAVEGYPPGQRAALESAGGRVLVLPEDGSGRVHLPGLLGCLGEMGVSSLMVEGGAQVISSFLSQTLVDQVILTIAPMFLGGLKALDQGVFAFTGSAAGGSSKTLTEVGYERLGEDLIVWGKLAH